jgi:hypothetical protein
MRQDDPAPVDRNQQLFLDHIERSFDSAVDIDMGGSIIHGRFHVERNGVGAFLEIFFDLVVFADKIFRS